VNGVVKDCKAQKEELRRKLHLGKRNVGDREVKTWMLESRTRDDAWRELAF
jgi:hypothetical protein